MSLRIDLHVHTQLHSPCSKIDPELLIYQAVKAGLDGLVITEHEYQWREEDLTSLRDRSAEPGFLLLSGMEYWSKAGDILIYGLQHSEAMSMKRGLPPEEVVGIVHEMGGVCVAAHPTRAGMGFDGRITTMPIDALEVRSVNLLEFEQRLANYLADEIGRPKVAGSDAHRLHDVGAYATEFLTPIQTMANLQDALKHGRFQMTDVFKARAGAT